MTITQALLLYAEQDTRFTSECIELVRHIELGQRQLFTRKAAQFLTRRLEEDDAFPEGARARIQEALDQWADESPEDAKQVVHLPHAPRRGPRGRGTQSPIAMARMAAGMTQAQLAEAIGKTQRDVSRWERGVCAPRADVLIGIAGALKCPLADLIEAKDNSV